MTLFDKIGKFFTRPIRLGGACAIMALLFCLNSAAQDELYTNALPGDSLQVGKSFTTQDTVFFNPTLKPTISQTVSVNDILNFSINELSRKYLPDSFNVTLTLRIIYTNVNNAKDSISSQALTITYNKNKTYNNKAIITFANAYRVQVKVLAISAQFAPLAAILHSLQLENDIDINRTYTMDCVNNAVQSVGDSVATVTTAGELKVFWTPSRVAQSYDLEWAWVDQSALAAGYYSTAGQPDPALIFKNNATRITTTGNVYSIPMLYDGNGSLFFRVRGVQTQSTGERMATSWSSDFISSGGLGRYDFTGHARNLNWQVSTTYAEEGKRKTVMQYFDGSQRARQTVTKDNSTNTTLVSETLYDRQGKPAIQVLPAPTLNTIINYTPFFNVADINGKEYDKGIYDTLVNSSDYCTGFPDSMSVATGAAQYYSPANPLAGQSFHRFIPNANGYAFTQTEYTQDNTGRVYRQGGVGPGFQIGSGHEIKYYYSSPFQSDLDAIFGTEAGDASHYQKNMIRDANGQYTVTYSDMQGRTIATALAGTPPANLQQLPSYRDSTQTDNLLNSNNNILSMNQIQSSGSLLVTRAGLHTFVYKMASPAMTILDCQSRNICYDCLYNLDIVITDNCNNQLLGGSPLAIHKQNFRLFQIDTSCNMVVPMDTSFSATLPEGEYNITKTLSISKYAMQYYHDSLFLPHNTCRSYQDILKEQMDSVRNRFSCQQAPDTTATYTTYQQAMLQDLTPESGQYADTSLVSLGFSLFNKSGDGTFRYQHPNSPYLDANGKPDSVTNSQGILVPPQQLSESEFLSDFQDSWANALLDQHPEYCLLKNYDTLAASLKWDDDFQKTDSYAAALAKGYLNPTGNASRLPASKYGVLNPDPLYKYTITDVHTGQQVGAEALVVMEDSLFASALPAGSSFPTITLWGLSTILGKCQDASSTSCFNTYAAIPNAFNTDSLCVGDLDMSWRVFRGLYEKLKAAWVDKYMRSQCPAVSISSPFTPDFPQASPVMAAQGYTADGSNHVADSLSSARNAAQYFASTCTGYATAWWQQLAPCNYTHADSLVIVPRLIKVCELGSDNGHQLGSSSISPDSSYRFSSFDDVIKQYNDSAYGGAKSITQCNSYLITQPLPYAQSQLLVNEPLWTKPSACECSNISNYYTQYQAFTSTYPTFSAYMQLAIGVTISQGSLDTLRNLCNGSIPCKYIPSPINLPPGFQCGVTNVCANCTLVQTWYSSFQQRFPGVTPAIHETDTFQQATNRLFASFMNDQSGFSYTAQDYLVFMDTCSQVSVPRINCSSLTWTVFNPGTNLSINGDLLTAATDDILPVEQFFPNNFFDGPASTQAGDYVLVDKTDSVSTGDTLALMQWRVRPGAAGDMVNPIIQTGTQTYVGAQWIKDPADTNWLIGSTNIRVLNGVMKGVGLQSNSHGLQADWVKITSVNTGTVLFFDDFLQAGNCPVNGYVGGPHLCGKSQGLDVPVPDPQTSPCTDTTNFAISLATQIYNAYRDSVSDSFNEAYTQKCLTAISLESFTVLHPVSEYHYTLFYYDQAGNRVKTISAEGVHPNRDPIWLAQVATMRASGNVLVPNHTMPSINRYNSLNLIVSQSSPDAGLTNFWYDRLGRLAISQNAKQRPLGNYSYTLYDLLGRTTEAGQKLQPTLMSSLISRNPQSLSSWLSFNNAAFNYNAVQVTHTGYDLVSAVTLLTAPAIAANPVVFTQQPNTLRNRISYLQYYDVMQNTSSVSGGVAIYTPVYGNYTTGTYYAYDIHGNVDTLLQDYRLGAMANHGYNRFKEIVYSYDLISNKVNQVHYQPGAIDQFYHRYEYDAENRITDVYTSTSKVYLGHPNLEEHEAFYSYYKHGSVARMVIGQQQVQGTDYAYTLQGWLKGANGISLTSAGPPPGGGDMGGDGALVARDAYGFNLNYFAGDYAPVNPGVSPFPGYTAFMSPTDYKPLYNGNISSMAVNIGKLNAPLLYNYQYDQLSRLVSMDAFTGLNQTANNWSGLTKIPDYQERATFDESGNIKTYLRNGTSAGGNLLAMDNLTYNYNRDANGQLANNKLRNINDIVPAGNYPGDVDNQALDNYSYDQIGNLTGDLASGISSVSWNLNRKISQIAKTDGSSITYTYDASGNRISKSVQPPGSAQASITWYVRDASTNVMAVYTIAGTALTQTEQDLYGSGRLGIFNRNINADAAQPSGTSANLIGSYFTSNTSRGNKLFELSNHLNNVLVTLTDKKLQHSSDGVNVDYFAADVASANDYYPFGMSQPVRNFNSSLYRYGFNGQEKSDEIKGPGNSYTAEFWEYDPRLGRRWNLDPSPTMGISQYSVFDNSPIWHMDIMGDTPTVHEAAQMADDSYNGYKDRKSIDGGWERMKGFDGVQFEDKRTDFQAALYSRTINGKTEYTFATAGTASKKDAWQDVIQAVGLSGQYAFSVQQAKNLDKLLKGQELTFTGHSLGGGTASANALATGDAAITFNAAGVSLLTKAREGLLNKNSSNIQAFIIPGEPVDYYQGKLINSTAEGVHQYVHPWFGKMGSFSAWLTKQAPQTIAVRIKLHLMSSMFAALDAAGYNDVPPAPPEQAAYEQAASNIWQNIQVNH